MLRFFKKFLKTHANMKKLIILSLISSMLLWSCTHEPVINTLDSELKSLIAANAATGSTNYYIFPESNDFANIPGQDPANKLNSAKVNLGNMLFFETAVGLDGMHAEGSKSYSCGSCHIPSAGFRPGAKQGIADGGVGYGKNGDGRQLYKDIYAPSEIDAQGIRALSVMNVAYVKNTLWSGQFGGKNVNTGTEKVWGQLDPASAVNKLGYEALEGQNIEGLKTHRMRFNLDVVSSLGYRRYFDSAFPEIPDSARYTPTTASFALSAYLRTLFSSKAPFQNWLKGKDNALTDYEKKGAILFFGKAGCVRCHREPNLGSMQFQAIGVKDLIDAGGLKTSTLDNKNIGRGGFTTKTDDMFKFRVPQLYNLMEGSFYFHGSSKKTLREVVDYFNKGVPENIRVPKSQISPYFTPLELTEQEVSDITAFLVNGLHDPELQRYLPKFILSGDCFPDNDPLSQYELGCK